MSADVRVCAECRWCERKSGEYERTGYLSYLEKAPPTYECLSAEKPLPLIDNVTGQPIRMACRTCRNTTDLCGPEGRWWEART